MGFYLIFLTRDQNNNNLDKFKKDIVEELDYSLNIYEYFKIKSFNLNNYRFILVDNDKKLSLYEDMDEKFYDELINSLRNLMIVGKNFDAESFKSHNLFDDWFDSHTNRT